MVNCSHVCCHLQCSSQDLLDDTKHILHPTKKNINHFSSACFATLDVFFKRTHVFLIYSFFETHITKAIQAENLIHRQLAQHSTGHEDAVMAAQFFCRGELEATKPSRRRKTRRSKCRGWAAEDEFTLVVWWYYFFKTGHCDSAVFSLFSGQQSPYMHPSAELYIPVSDVHPPSLAIQITLFSLLRGIKNFEKPKKTKKTKWQNPCPSIQKPRKTKKHKKKQNDRTHVSVSKNLEKQKKTKNPKRQNLCPSIWHRASTFVFFVFFGFSRQNQKKQKGRTYVPVSGMGPVLLFFFGFSRQNQKKNKKAEPMSEYLAWGQYFCFFFVFFGFSRQNQKNQKIQKGRTYVPVSGMGPVLLFFLFFLVFRGKTKKTKKNKKAEPMSQYLAWGQYFWFLCFFWFFEAKPKKTKKTQKAEPMSQYLAWGQYFCFFFVFFGFWR